MDRQAPQRDEEISRRRKAGCCEECMTLGGRMKRSVEAVAKQKARRRYHCPPNAVRRKTRELWIDSTAR